MDLSKYTKKQLKQIIVNYKLHYHIPAYSTFSREQLEEVIYKFMHFVDNELVGKIKSSVKLPEHIIKKVRVKKVKEQKNKEEETIQHKIDKYKQEYDQYDQEIKTIEDMLKAEYKKKYGYDDTMNIYYKLKKLQDNKDPQYDVLMKQLKKEFNLKTNYDVYSFLNSNRLDIRRHEQTKLLRDRRWTAHENMVEQERTRRHFRSGVQKKEDELKEIRKMIGTIEQKLREDSLKKYGMRDLEELYQSLYYDLTYNKSKEDKNKFSQKIEKLKKQFNQPSRDKLFSFLASQSIKRQMQNIPEVDELMKKEYVLREEIKRIRDKFNI